MSDHVSTAMRPLGELLPLDQARAIVASTIGGAVKGAEALPLALADGRVLLRDLVASEPVPAFERAMMDGYAIRTADLQGAAPNAPVELTRVGRVAAGDPPPLPEVRAGSCVEVATGCGLPPGADAVQRVEDTTPPVGVGDDRVIVGFTAAVQTGQHVGPIGADLQKGDLALPAGRRLGPATLGVAAALGQMAVEVVRRPRALVVPTGDEVATPGGPRGPTQVYDINTTTLRALLEAHGCEARTHPPVLDDAALLEEVIRSPFPGVVDPPDLVLLSGGTSAGGRDMLADILADLGTIHFHGVAVKPGKPLLFASVDGTHIFGMPGYPTSALMTAYAVVLPAVRTMAGLPPGGLPWVEATLAQDVRVQPTKTLLLPVRLEDSSAVPAFRGSSAITSMSEASGFVELPPSEVEVPAGTTVRVQLF